MDAHNNERVLHCHDNTTFVVEKMMDGRSITIENEDHNDDVGGDSDDDKNEVHVNGKTGTYVERNSHGHQKEDVIFPLMCDGIPHKVDDNGSQKENTTKYEVKVGQRSKSFHTQH